MRLCLFKGLFGVSNDGKLFTSKGRKLIKLPKSIAFFMHGFINKFGYIGRINGVKYINPFKIN